MTWRVVLPATLLALASCTMLPLPLQPSSTLLDRADRLVEQGDYAGAVKVYDELLAKNPDNRVAARAQASRQTVASLLAARADIARLRQELTARDAELNRLKQDLEKLREDLENLKKIDLRERRPTR